MRDVTPIAMALVALLGGTVSNAAHANADALVRTVVRGVEQLSRSCPRTCGELVSAGAVTSRAAEAAALTLGTEELAAQALRDVTLETSTVLQSSSPMSAAVQLPPGTPPAITEATVGHIAGVQTLMTEMERCGGEVVCLQKIAEKAGTESFWRRMLGRSCTFRHPDAMRNLLYGYVVHFSALAASLQAAPHEEFPYHLVANVIVMSAVWNEVGCRAELDGGLGKRVDDDVQLSWAQRFKKNYVGYLVLQPIGIGAVLAFSTVEDLIRGKEVLSADQLEVLAADALYQIGYGAVVAIPKGLLMNPAFYRWLPKMRRYLGEVYARTTLKVLPHRVASWAVHGKVAPGAVFDYGARSANNTFDTTLWLWGRQWLVPGRSGEHIATSEEAPEQ